MVIPPQTFLALFLALGTTLADACLAAAQTGAGAADMSGKGFLARVQENARELDTLDYHESHRRFSHVMAIHLPGTLNMEGADREQAIIQASLKGRPGAVGDPSLIR